MPTLPGGMNVVGIPAWLIAIASSFMISTEIGAAAVVGYLSQWTVKAPAGIRDWASPMIIVVGCGVLWMFVLGHRPETFTHWPPREWWAGFIGWAFSALGIASASGRTGGAPKTNSLGKPDPEGSTAPAG